MAGQLDLAGSTPIRNAIMHTRWASQGGHTYDNAHPVVAHNIALVHNGVIINDDELCSLAAIERSGEVDSWALAGILQNAANIDADAHPCDVFDLIQGDAAVAWLDGLDPQVLHLARLTGRPMTIGWTKRGDLVMSSTRQTLQRTARLAQVAISDMIDVPTWTYCAVRAGRIVEWRTIGKPDAHTPPVRGARQQSLPLTVRTEVPGKRGNPRRHRRAWPKQGITDLVENRPDDWWDEAAKQLGDDWADDNWPTGVEQIKRRPRNEYGW